jgi:peptide/nickel transport system permease protein
MKSRRRGTGFWRGFWSSSAGKAGFLLLATFTAMAIAHPILLSTVWSPSVYDPEIGYGLSLIDKVVVDEVTDPETEISYELARLGNVFIKRGEIVQVTKVPSASLEHPLGVDPLGRDVLSMTMAGARPTLIVGLAAALTIALVGMTLATIGAYRRGFIDGLLTHVSDAFLLFPAPLLMVVIGTSAVANSIGPVQFGIIYGVVAGAGSAAIVLRSHALTVLQRPFIEASKVAGAGGGRIVFRHLLPHLMPLAAVYMLIGVTGAVVADGFLSFVAYGSARFNWGTMINFAITFPSPTGNVTPWAVLISGGLAISLFSASFYLLAVGIRSGLPDDLISVERSSNRVTIGNRA